MQRRLLGRLAGHGAGHGGWAGQYPRAAGIRANVAAGHTMRGPLKLRSVVGITLVALLVGGACTGPAAAPSGGAGVAAPTPPAMPTTAPAPTTTSHVSPTPSPTSAPPIPTAAPLPERALLIDDGSVEPPFPRLLGKVLSLAPGGPSWPVPAERSGLYCQSPVVLSPGGRFALYGTASKELAPRPEWMHFDRELLRPGDRVTPLLRLLDTQTGEDSLFAEGACAPAWGADGRLAYVQGVPATVQIGESSSSYGNPGRVLVRASLKAEPVAWTSEPSGYNGLVWAGERLLAYRPRSSGELVVLDGPDQVRVLETNRPTLVAVSPDGARVLTTTRPPDALPFAAVARVVRVADGVELGRLQLHPWWDTPNLAAGAWAGDRVIATAGIIPEGRMRPVPVLVVLDVRPGRLAIEAILRFHTADQEDLSGQGMRRFADPRFLDAAQRRIGAWHEYPERYLECDLDAGRCVRGPNVEGGGSILDVPRGPAG